MSAQKKIRVPKSTKDIFYPAITKWHYVGEEAEKHSDELCEDCKRKSHSNPLGIFNCKNMKKQFKRATVSERRLHLYWETMKSKTTPSLLKIWKQKNKSPLKKRN